MKHKQGKAGAADSSSGADKGKEKDGKGSIDREGQIKLGILIRRMYEADLQKQPPENITDLVRQFDKGAPEAAPSDEDSRK